MIAWLDPLSHASPPLGEVTVMEAEGVAGVAGLMVKVPELVSVTAGLVVLVMRIR